MPMDTALVNGVHHIGTYVTRHVYAVLWRFGVIDIN